MLNKNSDRQRYGRGRTVSINTEWYGIKIYAEFLRVLTGMEDWAAFVAMVYKAIDKFVNEMLYNALVDAGNSLGSMWKKTGNVDAATLRTLCQDVEMTTGHDVVIMGTRNALANVTALIGAGWVSDNMRDEQYHTGRLGYWEGISLIELPNGYVSRDLTTKIAKDDLLFIMPYNADNKFIKLVNEGDQQVMQVTNPETHLDDTYSYEVRMKLGVGVVTNLNFGYWDIII